MNNVDEKKISCFYILDIINKEITIDNLEFEDILKIMKNKSVENRLKDFFDSNPKITINQIENLQLKSNTLELLKMYANENDINLAKGTNEELMIDYSRNDKILRADINNTTILPADKINELVLLAQAGDLDARNKVVESNLKWVSTIAGRKSRCKDEYLDCFQNGCLGLIAAIEKYDISKGYKFITYATFWIDCYIGRGYVKMSSGFILPVDMHVLGKKVETISREYYKKNGKKISNEELLLKLAKNQRKKDIKKAEKENKKLSDIKDIDGYIKYFKTKLEYLNRTKNIKSIDFPVNEEDTNSHSTYGDFIEDNRVNIEDDCIDKQLVSEILDLMDCKLTDREREILKLKCGFYSNGEEVTYTEIGKRYNFTYQRAEQIYEKAVKKIRKSRKFKNIY